MPDTLGMGSEFRRHNGAEPGAFEKVSEILEIGDLTTTRQTNEATNFDSGGYEEFTSGIRSSGELTIKAVYDKAEPVNEKLTGDIESDGLVQYELAFPDQQNTTGTFWALITSVQTAIPLKERMTQIFTLKISGKITWT
jgi:hypothetical protein